jgi:hypothetical protein
LVIKILWNEKIENGIYFKQYLQNPSFSDILAPNLKKYARVL